MLRTREIGDKAEGFDTVKFRHTYLQIPALLVDDKIINRLQVMAGALQNAAPPTSSNQLDAIDTLCTLFEKWKLLAPPSILIDSCPVHFPHVSLPPMPSKVQDMTPAPNYTNNPFHALENDDEEDAPTATTWSPPPLTASVPRTPAQCTLVAPFQQATPMRLVLDDVASPKWAQYNPTTKPTTTSKGVCNTKLYCSLHKVTSCTTAPQFFDDIGTILYPCCQNNTVPTHLGLPICWPIPSTAAFII
jgi:hypothetical protein